MASAPAPPPRGPRAPPRPVVYLLLGAPGCGKTAFLQKLTKSDPKEFHPPHHPYIIRAKPSPSRPPSPELHFYAGHLPWPTPTPQFGLPSEDPSTAGGGPVQDPDILLLTFSIPHRRTLLSLPSLHSTLPTPSSFPSYPILLLGLQRDARNTIPYSPGGGGGANGVEEPPFVTPSEGYAMAQRLGLDRYMECSALTGELMDKVEEDIVGAGVKLWLGREVQRQEEREEEGLWEGCVVV
ncbi:hypothetical protein EV426DRAFT_582517 [Tirmania nivea]|nr:hypothetical protein EV426DRAFT_582517 [Tirmania nivea]